VSTIITSHRIAPGWLGGVKGLAAVQAAEMEPGPDQVLPFMGKSQRQAARRPAALPGGPPYHCQQDNVNL